MAEGDISFELSHLAAVCHTAFDSVSATEIDNEKIHGVTRKFTQKLVQSVFALPHESSDVGVLVTLPEQNTIKLPRAQRVPEPKLEPKWEKFAKSKGILKKKKDRMVYDEDHDMYRPRYGYKGMNNAEMEIPIVEIKAGDDPNEDPWAAKRQKKKESLLKNVKQQLMNKKRAGTLKGYGSNGNGETLTPEPLGAKITKKTKAELAKRLQYAQMSTQSLGNFDNKLEGEPERKLTGKKRAFQDNLMPANDEKARMKAALRQSVDKVDRKVKKTSNSLKQYEGMIPDAPEGRFRKKKGSTDLDNAKESKGKGKAGGSKTSSSSTSKGKSKGK